jgi:hypothetical protein
MNITDRPQLFFLRLHNVCIIQILCEVEHYKRKLSLVLNRFANVYISCKRSPNSGYVTTTDGNISGSHSRKYEDDSLLGYCAI